MTTNPTNPTFRHTIIPQTNLADINAKRLAEIHQAKLKAYLTAELNPLLPAIEENIAHSASIHLPPTNPWLIHIGNLYGPYTVIKYRLPATIDDLEVIARRFPCNHRIVKAVNKRTGCTQTMPEAYFDAPATPATPAVEFTDIQLCEGVLLQTNSNYATAYPGTREYVLSWTHIHEDPEVGRLEFQVVLPQTKETAITEFTRYPSGQYAGERLILSDAMEAPLHALTTALPPAKAYRSDDSTIRDFRLLWRRIDQDRLTAVDDTNPIDPIHEILLTKYLQPQDLYEAAMTA